MSFHWLILTANLIDALEYEEQQHRQQLQQQQVLWASRSHLMWCPYVAVCCTLMHVV